MSILDRNFKLAIPCPKCKKEVQETIARLEQDPTLTCPACRASFGIKADDLRRKLQEVEQSLAEFVRKASINIKL